MLSARDSKVASVNTVTTKDSCSARTAYGVSTGKELLFGGKRPALFYLSYRQDGGEK